MRTTGRHRRLARCGLAVGLTAIVLLPSVSAAGLAAAPEHTKPSHPAQRTTGKQPSTSPSTQTQSAPPASSCNNVMHGKALTKVPWAQQQLGLQSVLKITEGTYLKAGTFDGTRIVPGDRVKVAMIDSGIDPSKPVFDGAHYVRLPNATPARINDCVGHGTAVASLILAQPGRSGLIGVAPDVELLSCLYTNSDTPTSAAFAIALHEAIKAHARVINVSSQFTGGSTPAVLAQLKQARKAGIVIVAAAGNDSSQGSGPYYPAAYSRSMPNVIAVSAVDESGSAGSFSFRGNYVDVTAPGVGIEVANRRRGGQFLSEEGTSFAAAFVTGTVALMLAADPDLTPAQLRQRLELTADPPPGSVPDPTYGYGMIDPLLAVSSVSDLTTPVPPRQRGGRVAAAAAPVEPDRMLQHRALALAFVLIGLAVLTLAGAAVVRGARRARHS